MDRRTRRSYIVGMSDDPNFPEAPRQSTAGEAPAPGDGDAASPRSLRRNVDDTVIAGVARGLGDRFDVDANIFRVLFVVLTLFWGLGVATYLALWVFLPRAEGASSLSRRPRPPVSTSHRLSVALTGAAIVVVAIVGVLALGATARHVAPSLSLLWLVFLVALAVVAIRTPARRLTLRRLFAITFLSGLSVTILLLGGLVAFLDSTGVALTGGNGVHNWQPTSISGVRSHYATEFGASTLDLSSVQFPRTGFTVDASVAAGVLRVVVPADAVVSVNTHVGVGTVTLTAAPMSPGPFSDVPGNLLTAHERAVAPHLVVDARVGIGHINVTRAAG